MATVDVQPIMGTIYERQLQARISKNFDFGDGNLLLAASAERPEQVEGMAPNLIGNIRLSFNGLKGAFNYATGAPKLVPLSINASCRDSQSVYINPATTYSYLFDWGGAIALDAMIPVIPASDLKDFSAIISGEWTMGSADSDPFNGGFTGGLSALATNTVQVNQDAGVAGFTAAGQYALVQIQSWNGQLQIHLPNTIGTVFTVGYGELYSPNVSSLYSTNAKGGQANYNDDSNIFVNVMQNITNNLRIGVEYARFDTHYLNLTVGSPEYNALDHRVQVSTFYYF